MLKLSRMTLLGALFAASLVFGQTDTARIVGVVADGSGAVVPGVAVTAINVDTNFTRQATTDASGQHAIRLLPTGSYRVEVNAPRPWTSPSSVTSRFTSK
jgi:hypothetical protein